MPEDLEQRRGVELPLAAAEGVEGSTWRAEVRDREQGLAGAPLRLVVARFAGGNALAMVLSLIGGILTARVVAPATLGLFNGFGLVLGYIPFLSVGAFNGLRRELPFFVGKGDRSRAASLTGVAQGWALVLGGATAAVLSVLSARSALIGDWVGAAGWATQAVSALMLFYVTEYLESTFRTRGDFVRLSAVSVVRSAVGVLGVGAAWLLGFAGLCARQLLVALAGLALLWVWRPISVSPRLDRRELKHLLVIGLPIFMVGQLYAWWTVLNQTLVFKTLGANGLGLLSLFTLSLAAMSVLPMAVTQVTYPRAVEMYGRREAIAPVVRYLVKPAAMLVLIMVPLVAMAWVALPMAVRLVLPKYLDGIPAAQWGLVCAVLMGLQPVNNVFVTAKKQGSYFVAIVVGIVANMLALAWLIRDGAYLAAFPQAMAIGRVVFYVLCAVFLVRLVRAEKVGVDAHPPMSSLDR